jgi:hypothetical protein
MSALPRVRLAMALLLLAGSAAHADAPDRRVREAVARDLLYCGSLYHGLSLKVPAGKHEAVARLGDSLIAGAATVLPDDPAFLKREHEAVRSRLAAELVDASGEKLGKLAQSADCGSFLQEDGIAAVIRKRSAALNP